MVETVLHNFQRYLSKYLYRVFRFPCRKKTFLSSHRVLARPSFPVDYCPGKIYDLQEIYEELNAQLFQGALRLQIGWFGRKATRKGKSVVLGLFHENEQLIRIHRSLDRQEIPRFFMEYLVYHEMVHSVVPREYSLSGCSIFHGKKFKEYEQRFPLYDRAVAWEKANAYLLRGYKKRVGGGYGRA